MRNELVAAGVDVAQILVTHAKPHAEFMAAAEDLSANLIILGACAVAADQQFALGTTTEKDFRKSAKSLDADLIIMGSVGRRGLPYVLMGSTAIKVARQLPCALLTVKHENALEGPDEEEFRTVHILFAEGKALLDDQSYEAAIDKFGQVLARCPFHTAALEGRAEALERRAQPDVRRQDQLLRRPHRTECRSQR